MYVHHFLRKVYEEGQASSDGTNKNNGYLGYIKSYVFAYSPKPFYYKIGLHNYTLEEIKHGLLRGNSKPPNSYMRVMSSNDERLNILNDWVDPRVNFMCLDYPNFLEHIDSFDGSSSESLEQGMSSFVTEILNAKVNIDQEQGEITLPSVLEAYKADFGGTDEAVLEFVFRYLEEEYDQDNILSQVKVKNILITYE